MSKNLLLIFTRNPELGKVKTRLAKTIGSEKALEIYITLLEHTREITQNLPCDKAVYYSEKIIDNDIWSSTIYQKHRQQGADLGEKMQTAFEKAFVTGYKKVIVIGSDLYDITQNHINKAFEQLTTHDVVMGPAEDGGYYLLGMKTLHKAVFKNKQWGAATVKKDTLIDLQKNSIHFLEPLNDIDVYEDLHKHQNLLDLLKK